jgi:hypothetical protein
MHFLNRPRYSTYMVQVGYGYYGHSGIVVKCAEFNHHSIQSETLYITSSIPGGGTFILL